MAGYTRMPGQSFTRELQSGKDIKMSGMVVMITSGGKVRLASNTDKPYAVALESTRNETKYALTGDESFKTGGNITLTRGGQVRLPVAKNNRAISIGDPLVVGAETGEDGKVDSGGAPLEPSAAFGSLADAGEYVRKLQRVVGIAEEAVPIGTSTTSGAEYVLASLCIRGMGIGP